MGERSPREGRDGMLRSVFMRRFFKSVFDCLNIFDLSVFDVDEAGLLGKFLLLSVTCGSGESANMDSRCDSLNGSLSWLCLYLDVCTPTDAAVDESLAPKTAKLCFPLDLNGRALSPVDGLCGRFPVIAEGTDGKGDSGPARPFGGKYDP